MAIWVTVEHKQPMSDPTECSLLKLKHIKIEQKAYSKPKLEYNFRRSSRVSSVPMLHEVNQINA